MFTYSFISHPKTADVRVRIIANRKAAEVSLGLKATDSQIKKASSPKAVMTDIRLRNMINMITAKLSDIQLDLVEKGNAFATCQEVKQLLLLSMGKVDQPSGMGPFMEHFIRFRDTHDNPRTRNLYDCTISRMRAYDPKADSLPFEAITVEWLRGFDEFMLPNAPSANSRAIHFRNIRAVIRDARADDLTNIHPFDRFKIKQQAGRKRSYDITTLRRIFITEFPDTVQSAVDFFKLSFMLIGINVADLCALTEIDAAGYISYDRAKTHRHYEIKVEPEAMELIEKHRGAKMLLNFAEGKRTYRNYFNTLCKGLRRAKDIIGIPELTTYWARHTWATVAADLDIPDATISSALGHGGENRVTDIYIRRSQRKIDDANRRVLDYVLYGKI